MYLKETLVSFFSCTLNGIFSSLPQSYFEGMQEIRVRVDKPLLIKTGGIESFVSEKGEPSQDVNIAYRPRGVDIADTLAVMSRYSMYAFEEELKCGYITLPGGHRVGVTGKAVLENNVLKTLRNINGLNIRVSHEIKGCAEKVIKHIVKPDIKHTLIISPPGCGKTTLLRDIVRLLSDGLPGQFRGRAIGLVDERSEIAGCYNGTPQNEIGIRTDVLDSCPKAEGMLMLLRSMSPEVIAVDEIGSADDIRAIEYIINGGIKLVCTVHGYGIENIKLKPAMEQLLNNKLFQLIIVLSGQGRIAGLYNGDFQPLGEACL